MKTLIKYLTESSKKSISKSNYESFLKEKGMDEELRKWYKDEFSTDNLGDELPSDTFAVVLAALFNNPEEFEENYCADDSIVRERVFQKLADLFWGGALVLASSDIFGEEDPMNYALLDFGMRSFATAVEFMIEYYGLEMEDKAQEIINALLEYTIEEYTLAEDYE
mgnify:CR=1 FL=1